MNENSHPSKHYRWLFWLGMLVFFVGRYITQQGERFDFLGGLMMGMSLVFLVAAAVISCIYVYDMARQSGKLE